MNTEIYTVTDERTGLPIINVTSWDALCAALRLLVWDGKHQVVIPPEYLLVVHGS